MNDGDKKLFEEIHKRLDDLAGTKESWSSLATKEDVLMLRKEVQELGARINNMLLEAMSVPERSC